MMYGFKSSWIQALQTNCWETASETSYLHCRICTPIWQLIVQRSCVRIPAASTISEQVTLVYCCNAPRPIPLLSRARSVCYPSNCGWISWSPLQESLSDKSVPLTAALYFTYFEANKKTHAYTQTKIQRKASTRTYYYWVVMNG